MWAALLSTCHVDNLQDVQSQEEQKKKKESFVPNFLSQTCGKPTMDFGQSYTKTVDLCL